MIRRSFWILLLPALLAGCEDGHGPIAEDIMAPLGQPLPTATAEHRATFERGLQVMQRRFDKADGLGPAFNVTFCGACHERPVFGGSGGTYRNFAIAARVDPGGAYFTADSAGDAGGVQRLYLHGAEGAPGHPEPEEGISIVGQRNPIPFFGVGLLAELPEAEILKRSDPEDEDGDGISGRPNYDRGFVGRFGRKAQTVSIEGFIRGPLFNHLGVTTDPLSAAQKAALPVDSSGSAGATASWFERALRIRRAHAQVAAPDGPLTDDDGVADPEMSTEDLFDLVSFSMLLAAPEFEELSEAGERGRDHFDAARCGDCHVPRIEGPKGPIPVYSDLLIHDMGEGLADGLRAGEATGSEFRTQPLWGLASTGPYLHDGSADTIEQATLRHGGEGQASRDLYAALSAEERADLEEFLLSLGGRAQYTPGLIPPDETRPEAGSYGGPMAGLSEEQSSRFFAGRALFDREFGVSEGTGAPRFNGDSCRAYHFEPVVGGAGPRGVDVIRHGLLDDEGAFVMPAAGSILHRQTSLHNTLNPPQPGTQVFELRQTPHLFGLGLLEAVSEAEIVSRADPEDLDGDGISGKVSRTDGGLLGRFGWKAQVPSLEEFVRDAVAAELGMTLPLVPGLTFGRIHDNDEIEDPEMGLMEAGLLHDYLALLAAPPRTDTGDAAAEQLGEQVFAEVGCEACHTPALAGPNGPVPAYTDLLLHAMKPDGAPGIEDAAATMQEFRTAPLWGLARTAPYLHDGSADTIEQAIQGHAAEADAARSAFEALPADRKAALLIFLSSL